LQRYQHAHAILCPFAQLRLPIGFRGDQPLAGAMLDVGTCPPAGKRGQIVRARRHQGFGRIRVRGPEIARTVTLEYQDAVRQDGILRQRGTHIVGHGAQIFADHDALMAMAFEREEAEEVVERIVDVCTVRRPAARGDPE
jgi:hypothetical protein